MIGYWQRKKKSAHERSLRMNKARWDADRLRRDKLAAMHPLQWPGRIVLRVVVIRNESEAQEAVIFDTDSRRDERRKLRRIGL